MKRKIEAMYERFGRSEGKCKDCIHLKRGSWNYPKCEVYGMTASEASDFRLKYDACGLFNKPYESDIPIIRLLDRGKNETPIEGQMSLGDYL